MRRALMTLGLVALLVATATAITPIQVDGSTIQGSLDPTDIEYMPPGPSRANPSYYRDVYTFEAPASAYVDIRLNCSFDGYLYLFGPNSELIMENDDYQTTSAARISTSLTQPGTHYIVVTSFSSGATGSYGMTVGSQDPDAIEGAVIQGTLDPSDTAMVQGAYDRSDPAYYRDVYPGPGLAGQMITIDLRSDFDGYLYLLGPDGNVVASDDDFGSTRASRIENAIMPTSGNYQIVVTSFSSGTTGNYTLTIGNPQMAPPASSDMPISAGIPIQGQLAPGDNAALPAGDSRSGASHFRDGYFFPGTPGQQVEINATYSGFDGYLFLVGPNGQITDRNDDFQGTSASRISTTLTQSGTYRIVVTTYSSGASGAYTLVAGPPSMAAPTPPQPPQPTWGTPTAPQTPSAPISPQQPAWSPAPTVPAPVGPAPSQPQDMGPVTVYDTPSDGQEIPRISLGEVVRGSLTPGDREMLPSGISRHGTYLNDRYDHIPAPPGLGHLVVEVMTDFTSRIYLRDPFGAIVARADATPPGQLTILEIDSQYSAPYTVIISTEEQNVQGNYILTIRSQRGSGIHL